MFGLNEHGETVTIFVKDYLPFFFVKVPKYWNMQRAKQFVGRIMYQMGSYCKDSFLRHELLDFNKLYGFSAGQKHQFLKLYFKNTVGMRRVKNMWYQYDKQGNMRMVNYNFEGEFLELYESNIPPLLRYFHIQNISPSGWVRISDKIQPLLDRTTTTSYEFVCNQADIIPMNDCETRVPYKICSFDIEASSSHGDFPIPVKSYKRLATNLIDYYLQDPAKYVNSDGTPRMAKLGPMLESVIENAFGLKRDNPDIDLVYPKTPFSVIQNIGHHVSLFTSFAITETAVNNQANSVESVFEKLIKQSAAAMSTADEDAEEDGDGMDEDSDADAVVAATTKIPVRHGGGGNPATKVPKSQTVLQVITHPNYSRDEKIQYMTTAFDTCGLFPQLEGDKCTFIGSTFLRYGESEPYLNHCVVLGGCDPVDGAVIETAETEEELLMRWRNLIVEEDPDIIIGYNIFGFDYEFLFRRAEENHCERPFLTFSRIIGELTAKEQMRTPEGGGPKVPTGKLMIEHTKVVLASGEYDLRYFNMTGRLQIDMYSYLRRDFNLASYKLDDVAGQFISDDIKRVDVSSSEGHTRLFSKNLMGLHVGDYIHIELNGFTADYYMDGHKFQVQNILYDQTYVSVKGGVEKTETANVIVLQGIYSELADMFAAKTLKWCMAKDDVSPQDIFRLTNGSDADRARVAKYCLQDCNLVHHLMRKIDVITGYIEMSSICSVPISYLVFRGQGIKLTSYVAKKCREKNTLMPDLQKSSGGDGYEGAIVLPPKCAMYMDNPVACVDYSSLYPSSMISQNYSHDSKVWTREYDLNGRVVAETGDKDASGNYLYDNLPGYEYINVEFETFKYVRPKGNPKAAARKEKTGHKVVRWAQLPAGQKSIMPSILEELLQARSKTRKLIKNTADPFMQNILDKRQLGYKVTANSLYGQCGAKTSTFYEQDVAASTTATGRTMIIYAKRMIEEVYGDRVYETAALGPVQCRAEYVYGDSVANYTPVKIRARGDIHICTIEELAKRYGGDRWVLSEEPGKQSKEYCELPADIESWTETGWTKIHRVIRHTLAKHKRMIRVLTHTGLVDVTDDHSLILANGAEISPRDCQTGVDLLHSPLPFGVHIQLNEYYEVDGYNRFISDDHTYLATIASLMDQNKFRLQYDPIDGMIALHKHKDYLYDTDKTQIVSMHEIPYEGFVYDLTTENHHFAAGIGNLIVHNTDSVFFTFNLENPNTGTKIRGKPALEATIEIAQDVAKLCTQFLKPPMELSYEKTLMNFILLAKKRYVGMLHETDPNKGYLKFMGLSLKRRDSCDYLKDTYGGILNILMKENSIKPAIDFLNTSLNNLLAGTVPMDKLAITKALRSGYKNPKQIAHCVLADRIGKRDPGNKPKPGDRMKFVYFVNSDKGALQGDKIELPQYIIDAKLKIDYKFYITNQLMKPLQQLFGLALEQIYAANHVKKGKIIGDFLKRIKQIQKETPDLEEYMKRREKECSARVKQELFDPFLMKIQASQNGIRQLDSFWTKAKTVDTK
jgi:DNA polymerase elongation subunit (family B)